MEGSRAIATVMVIGGAITCDAERGPGSGASLRGLMEVLLAEASLTRTEPHRDLEESCRQKTQPVERP